MQEIEIKKIILKENIRSDYGDLIELTASIKEHGVRKPLELTSGNVLMDGYRRLKAARAAGLEKVPFFHSDGKIDKTTTQMIVGIFQKNLNPIEQGKAFRNYIDAGRMGIETFAKRISKPVDYIKKRLLLVNLSKDVQKALIEKKILMGHALILAKLTKKDGLHFLKEIIRDKHGVEEAKESIQYSEFSLRLDEAKFNKSECRNCKYNGSEQAELFEMGTILNGRCMNRSCFHKKVKEFVSAKRKEFKDVIFKGENDYDTPSGYTDGSHEGDCKDKGITDKHKIDCRNAGREKWLVRIRDNGEITEFFRAPASKDKKKPESSEDTRKQKLLSRVSDHKKEFLIKMSVEMMQPGTKEAKVLTLIKLIRSATWDELEGEFNKIFNLNVAGNVKKIYKSKEEDIDKAISYLSRKAFRLIDLKELIEVSRNFKVDMKKHFLITSEFLELYTKDQLMDLIGELKLEKAEKLVKKGEIIQHILNQNLKGKVPKILI